MTHLWFLSSRSVERFDESVASGQVESATNRVLRLFSAPLELEYQLMT